MKRLVVAEAASRTIAKAEGRIVNCERCLDTGYIPWWDGCGQHRAPCLHGCRAAEEETDE